MAKKRASLDDSVPRDKHGEEIKVGQKVEVQCFLNAGALTPAPGRFGVYLLAFSPSVVCTPGDSTRLNEPPEHEEPQIG